MDNIRTKKDSYLVEGMTCSGCERTVSKVVGNIEGVQSVRADLSSSTVSVEYDPSKVTIDKIRSAVNAVGGINLLAKDRLMGKGKEVMKQSHRIGLNFNN